MRAPLSDPTFISSRDNPLLKEVRKLAQDSTAYRKLSRVWLEGDHLCGAALDRGVRPVWGIYPETYWASASSSWVSAAAKNAVVPDALFRELSGLESPGKLGFVIDLPQPVAIAANSPSVVLDRVQDAGNVGSILRSAGAFGFRQVLALTGTAALWSPKVLRSGMGAHFGLQLHEGLSLQDLDALEAPLVVTSSHEGELIQKLSLPFPCVWAFGHEGQGVGPGLLARAKLRARIGQPGGEESLNVGAAAAICLHISSLLHPASRAS
jgi:TrmH family RNA methyltransferase